MKYLRVACEIALGIILVLQCGSMPVLAADVDVSQGTLGTPIRFAGPFENTTLKLGGTVIIDMNISPTSVSGYINFTNDPDVGNLCGAGSFSGSRTGDNFQFTFTSSDSDPGCGVAYGTTFNVSGVFSQGAITNGQFSHPATGQSGTFSAKQTTHYIGSFVTNGYPGTVTIDVVKNSSTMVTGYMNFTNNPGVGALCGAGSFRGSINSSGSMSYDFLSNDHDGGCGFDFGLEFQINAVLSGLSITNGRYTVVDTGQSGTFSTACGGGNSLVEPDTSINEVCPVDTTAPTGKIIWPYETYIDPKSDVLAREPHLYGPGDIIRIEAIASDNLTGVERVEFWVSYDGQWHRVGDEYFSPYEVDFTIPDNLQHDEQLIKIGIHVVDKQGNVAIDPEGNPRGLRYANYDEDYNDTGVVKNWIPAGNRAYVNQRALPDTLVRDVTLPVPLEEYLSGDYQCGAASIAMVLRMFDKILGDYQCEPSATVQCLAPTAKAAFQASTTMYDTVNRGWRTNWVYDLMSYAHNPQHYAHGKDDPLGPVWHKPASANAGWGIIIEEIDNGRPVIVLSTRNGFGAHYFVVVGYKIDGNVRSLIAYDPYGEWRGVHTPTNNYYANNTADTTSHKGQWVYYNFTEIWGYGSTAIGRVMTFSASGRSQQSHITLTGMPSTPPDIISDEPDTLASYPGIPLFSDYLLYLPLVKK